MNTESKTVLLVDDEPDFLAAAKLALESGGYEVLTAKDAHDALEADRRHPCALAILDINLPDLNGYTLCRELRDHHAGMDLPVIFLSIRVELRDALAGLGVGARDFLSKPVSRGGLLAAVQRALAA